MAVRQCSDSQDNDQPDYDSVASDEDTDQELPSSKGDRTKVTRYRFHRLKPRSTHICWLLCLLQVCLSAFNLSVQQSLDSDLSDSPITMQEYLDVKNALSASEAKIQHLMKANNNLSDELRLMQKKVSTAVQQ